jgi:hypothetical protein
MFAIRETNLSFFSIECFQTLFKLLKIISIGFSNRMQIFAPGLDHSFYKGASFCNMTARTYD